MFERITFKAQDTKSECPLDIGLLLECMIFYGKVSVVANRSILKQLVYTFDFPILNELIDRGVLEILYAETVAGVRSNPSHKQIEIFDPIIFSSPQHTLQTELRKICKALTGKEGRGRRNALRLEKKIIVSNHELSVAESCKKLFLDKAFLDMAVPTILSTSIPNIGSLNDVRFSTEEAEHGIIVKTNLDFDYLNQQYHKFVSPKHSSINAAFILAGILEAECDLYFASRQLSEIATTLQSSQLIAARLAHLSDRCTKSSNHKDSFQEFIFDRNKTIREHFNQGDIKIADILPVIFKADKFKKWLIGKDIDIDLLREYYKEATKETIVDKLPGKSVRWSIFTGTGVVSDLLLTGGVGTLTGVALSVLDGFFVDKLLQGWKPNQFVEQELRPLLPRY